MWVLGDSVAPGVRQLSRLSRGMLVFDRAGFFMIGVGWHGSPTKAESRTPLLVSFRPLEDQRGRNSGFTSAAALGAAGGQVKTINVRPMVEAIFRNLKGSTR